MQLLLDTHAVLWAVSEPGRLGAAARDALLDPANELAFSTASVWEIAIKQSLGRLELLADWPALIDRERRGLGARWLAVLPTHCVRVATLPWHHRDPFDRMLVAQAMAENMGIVTRDEQLAAYAVSVVW